jgi:hypothetical protein
VSSTIKENIDVVGAYLPTSNPAGVTNPPVALWQLDGTANSLIDRTGNGYDLVNDQGGAGYDTAFNLTGFRFNGSRRLVGPNTEALRLAKEDGGGGSGALTLELTCRLIDLTTTQVLVACHHNGESLQTNFLYRILMVSDRWDDFNEENAGGNVTPTPAFLIGRQAETHRADTPVYMALTVDATGTTRNFYIGYGGELNTIQYKEQFVGNTAEKAAAGNTQLLVFGRQYDNNVPWNGVLYSSRITDEEFTPAEIDLAYQQTLINSSQVSLPVNDQTEESVPADSGAEDELNAQPASAGRGKDAKWTYPEGKAVKLFTNDAGGEDEIAIVDPAPATEKWTFPDKTAHMGTATYRTSTLDPEANYHLGGRLAERMFFYDRSNDPWSAPTANSFSGFGADGFRYTNGVQDGGPVQAQWSSEPPGATRSNRNDFPVRTMLVETDDGIDIWDLDDYEASGLVTLWMRFEYATSGNFNAIGYYNRRAQDIKMSNGVLVLVTVGIGTGGNSGGVFAIDFKADDEQYLSLVRSDDEWRGFAGQDITDRNNTGLGKFNTAGVNDLRLGTSWHSYRVAVQLQDDPTEPGYGDLYVAVGHDLGSDMIYNPELAVPAWRIWDTGSLASSACKGMLFDQSKWLWAAYDTYIYRHGLDYINRNLTAKTRVDDDRKGWGYPKNIVDLGTEILDLVASGNYLYAATEYGVYQIDRYTLDVFLRYSIVGGGGGGRLNTPPAGEILRGNDPVVKRLSAYTFKHGATNTLLGYLAVATDGSGGGGQGGVTLLRLHDDVVQESLGVGAGIGMDEPNVGLPFMLPTP